MADSIPPVDSIGSVTKRYCDLFVAWLQYHEAEDHDGGFCSEERGNVLAYIAHRIGHDGATLRSFVERLDFYDQQHSTSRTRLRHEQPS